MQGDESPHQSSFKPTQINMLQTSHQYNVPLVNNQSVIGLNSNNTTYRESLLNQQFLTNSNRSALFQKDDNISPHVKQSQKEVFIYNTSRSSSRNRISKDNINLPKSEKRIEKKLKKDSDLQLNSTDQDQYKDDGKEQDKRQEEINAIEMRLFEKDFSDEMVQEQYSDSSSQEYEVRNPQEDCFKNRIKENHVLSSPTPQNQKINNSNGKSRDSLYKQKQHDLNNHSTATFAALRMQSNSQVTLSNNLQRQNTKEEIQSNFQSLQRSQEIQSNSLKDSNLSHKNISFCDEQYCIGDAQKQIKNNIVQSTVYKNLKQNSPTSTQEQKQHSLILLDKQQRNNLSIQSIKNKNYQNSDNSISQTFKFFKEVLDYLDCSLFVVDEDLQIVYHNNLANQMIDAINQQACEAQLLNNQQNIPKFKSSTEVHNKQNSNSQSAQHAQFSFTNRNLQEQIVSQIVSSPQFCAQAANNCSFSQNIAAQFPKDNLRLSVGMVNNLLQNQQNSDLKQKESCNTHQLRQQIINNQLNQQDQVTQNRIQQKRESDPSYDKSSQNITKHQIVSNPKIQNRQESQRNLFKSITIYEFSKQSQDYLKTIGLDSNVATNLFAPQLFQDDYAGIFQKNQISNANQQSMQQIPNLGMKLPILYQQSSTQSPLNSTPLDCSFLLEDVIKSEERRRPKSFNINIFDLVKKIIYNLSDENSYSVIEPVSCKVDDMLESINHYNIKLVGKIINKRKYVIITFSDNQEKEAQLNKRVERNIFQTISHELGTYTNFIQTFTQTALLDDNVPKSVKQNYLKYMDSNIFLVSQVVQDIRDYYEHQNNALKIIWKDINLVDLLSKICKHFKKLAKIKQIVFKCDVIDIPEKICADEIKTQSVIVNLLSNAFKFSSKNGCVIIQANYKKEEDLIKISIIDSGIGMSQVEQIKLKQLLNGKSLQSKVSLNSSGFGFGLTISNILAKKIINRPQNNSIQFTSKENQGSTFWFYLDATPMIKKINRISIQSSQNQKHLPQNQLHLMSCSNISPQKQPEDTNISKPFSNMNDSFLNKENDQFTISQQIFIGTKRDINQLNQIVVSQINDEQALNQQVQQNNQAITNNSFNYNINNQQLVGSSQYAQSNSNQGINSMPQLKLQQPKFRQNQQQQNNIIQQSVIGNNPKILEKYIILSNQEIIEIQESDIYDYSDICSKIFQKDLAQSQPIDSRLQSELIKQSKAKKNSIESFILSSDIHTYTNNNDQIAHKQIKNCVSPLPKTIPMNNITQSFVITSTFKDQKKKSKEDQRLTKNQQQLPLQVKSASLKSSKINESKELNSDLEISFIDIPPIESIQVQLPKQVQNKFLSANKIMIVDDEPMNIKGLQIMLKVKADISEDFIITATNGVEAVEQFQKNQKTLNSFKLIFMDINMPIMDGIEATKMIRQLERLNKYKRTNICAYTCWTDLQTKIKCSQAGMDNYFSKPITHDQLMTALNRYYFNFVSQ